MTRSQSAARKVRIIGGRFRGRIVHFPAAAALRPTPDRVRETLFNWLHQDLTGQATLDLYAGSGALSLEALSRGAVLAVAVDNDPSLIRALTTTAATFGATGLVAVVDNARRFLARETRLFDVIFLDPPFAADDWDWLLPECAERLAPGGFIYAEASRHLNVSPPLAVHRCAKAGQVHYHLLANAQRPQAQ